MTRFLEVRVPHCGALGTLLELVERGGRALQEHRVKRLLLDCSVHPRLGLTEQVILAHHLAQHLGGLERVALVYTHCSGEAEALAQRMGLNLFVFKELADAREWISELRHEVQMTQHRVHRLPANVAVHVVSAGVE